MTWDVHNLMQPKKPSRFHGSTDPTPAAGAIAHLVQHMDPEVLHVDSWRMGVGFLKVFFGRERKDKLLGPWSCCIEFINLLFY